MCRIFLSLALCNTSLFLTQLVKIIFSIPAQHDTSNLFMCFWSTSRKSKYQHRTNAQVSAPYKCPSINTIQMSKCQHHTNLCFICSSLLVSSLSISPIFRWKILLLVDLFSCHGNSGYNFMCKSCIVCYHATNVSEIFYTIWLILIYHNPYRE